MGQIKSEGCDPELPDFPSETGEPNPCAALVEHGFMKVYHLAEKYVTGGLYTLLETDFEMFELAIITHGDTRVHHIKDFQTRFNTGLSQDGYIVIK